MANISLTTDTYAGYFSDVIIASSVLGARTIENGYITLHTNVDDKATAVFADTAVNIKDANGEFASSSTTSLDEIKFNLGKYMINAEIDYKALDSFWLAAQQPRGAAGDYAAPATLEDAFNAHFAQKASLFVGASIWNGSAAAITQFGASQGLSKTGSNAVTGLIDKMLADSSVNDVAVQGTFKQTITSFTKAGDAEITVTSNTGLAVGDKVTFGTIAGGSAAWTGLSNTTHVIKALVSTNKFEIELDTSGFASTWSGGTVTVINKSNVVAALEACYEQMPDSIRLAPDTAIYVSSRIAAAYKMAQAQDAYSPNVYSSEYALRYLGYDVYEIPEMRHNAIVVSRVSNLHFATPLLSDLNSVLIADQAAVNASRTIRYRLDFCFDVNISDGKSITLLS
tara:strand:- start:1715 stop:2905 length:1191 start_codon:yes stop_codon:yes gene_type:complete